MVRRQQHVQRPEQYGKDADRQDAKHRPDSRIKKPAPVRTISTENRVVSLARHYSCCAARCPIGMPCTD